MTYLLSRLLAQLLAWAVVCLCSLVAQSGVCLCSLLAKSVFYRCSLSAESVVCVCSLLAEWVVLAESAVCLFSSPAESVVRLCQLVVVEVPERVPLLQPQDLLSQHVCLTRPCRLQFFHPQRYVCWTVLGVIQKKGK